MMAWPATRLLPHVSKINCGCDFLRREVNTFSIIARCPRTGQLGVAVASAVPAVGSMCPFVRSGVGAASLADNMKAIPQFVVHGDADNTVNVSGSRNMVAALKKLNANVTYVEVPGGSHTDVVVPNLPQAFEFMAAQRKGGAATSTKQ